MHRNSKEMPLRMSSVSRGDSMKSLSFFNDVDFAQWAKDGVTPVKLLTFLFVTVMYLGGKYFEIMQKSSSPPVFSMDPRILE